jgi:hypothetical protein
MESPMVHSGVRENQPSRRIPYPQGTKRLLNGGNVRS